MPTPAEIIQNKYNALQQKGIILGVAQGAVTTFAQGAFRIYEKGIIYAIGTSARSVHSRFFPIYKSHQYHNGVLGIPMPDVADEALPGEPSDPMLDRSFANGAIYLVGISGGYAVYTPIHQKWASLGGFSTFGLPSSKVLTASDGVKYQNFDKGRVIITPQNGPKGILEPILTSWLAGGGSPGYPTTDTFKVSGKPGMFLDCPRNFYSAYKNTPVITLTAGFLDTWRQAGGINSPAGLPVTGRLTSPYSLRTNYVEHENEIRIIKESAVISKPTTLATRLPFALTAQLPVVNRTFMQMLSETMSTMVRDSPDIREIPGTFKLGQGTVVKVVPYTEMDGVGLIRRCLQVKFNFTIEDGILSLASGSFTLDLEPLLTVPAPNFSANTPPDLSTMSATLRIRPIRFTSSITISLLANCAMTPSTARAKLKKALTAQTGPNKFFNVATLPGLLRPLAVRFAPNTELEIWSE